MGNASEAKVCRDIIDRHEVMETQVLSTVVSATVEKLDKEDVVKLRDSLKKIFSQHTNGLVDTVSNRFAD